ncbi:MAG: DUF222 domain-containing protein [Kofleriaceae bacterium]
MSVDIDALADRIATHAAHLDAATHTLLTDLREFDTASGWYKQGAHSCAEWLSWRVGWSMGTAREHLRVARRLAELPLIDEALRRGAVSYCKVRAITRVATPANEATLLEDARYATGSQLERICRKYAAVVRASKEPEESYDRERRYVRRMDLDDGMVKVEALLHPEEAAMVWAALEAVARAKKESSESSRADVTRPNSDETFGADVARAAQSAPTSRIPPREDAARRFDRADALVTIARDVLRGGRVQAVPTELIVTVAAETLTNPLTAPDPFAVTSDGTCVSAETARRLACDCGIVHMVEDHHGTTLSVGRKTRSIPVSIKRAMLKRDKTCRFPGCSNRIFIEGHHIQHWANGGETCLDNVLGMCSHHHRFVHEYGYRIELDEQKQPRFFDSRNRRVTESSPRPISPRMGMPALVDAHADLDVSAETNEPLWDGDPVNYGWAIDDLVRADQLQ